MAKQSKKSVFALGTDEVLSKGYAKQSKDKTKSAKGLVLFVALFVILADIASIVLMLIKGIYAPYIILPAVIVAVDVLFFIMAFFTNFRFHYAKKFVFLFFVVTVAVAVAYLYMGIGQTLKYFTEIGGLSFAVAHILLWLGVFLATQFAKKPKFKNRKIGTTLSTLLTVAVAVCYCLVIINNGSFGQGATVFNEERDIIYQLVESESAGNYFVAQDVVEGKGNKIYIPESFNGVPIKAVDCNIFTTSGIKEVVIGTSTPLALRNIDKVKNANAGLTLTVQRSTIMTYQSTLFDFAVKEKSNKVGTFLSAVVPEVEENEVFVTFSYDFEAVAKTPVIVETQIAKKAVGIDVLSALGENYRKLYNRRSDLAYNYANNDRYRMTELIVDGEAIETNKNATESLTGIEVGFERVYKINRSVGAFAYGGGWTSVIYTAESMKNNVLSYNRTGCVAEWRVRGENVTVKTEDELFAYLKNKETSFNDVNLTAEWRVIAPEISSLGTTAVGNSFVYGSTAQLTAVPRNHELTLKYRLLFPDGTIAEDWTTTSVFDLSAYAPSSTGKFKVEVIATDEYDSGLFARAEKEVLVTIGKKTLEFDWNVFEHSAYDGQLKQISALCREGQMVGTDTVGFTLSIESAKNAGTYTSQIVLSEDTAKKYKVSAEAEKEKFEIIPAIIGADWTNVNLIYNGKSQQPTATANGIAEDGSLEVSISGGTVNAGTYTAEATLSNSNYSLVEESKRQVFEIAKKEVSLTWDSASYNYIGIAIQPTATTATGIIEGEESEFWLSLKYSGAKTNTGTHNAEVTTSNGNYVLDNTSALSYSILAVALTVTADSKEKTYDGKTYSAFSITTSGLVGTDTISEVVGVQYSGVATSAILASDSDYEIVVSGEAQIKHQNYIITYVSGTLTILKRGLIVKADNATKTYDASVFDKFSYKVEGLQDGDSIEEVVSLSFGGTAINAVDVAEGGYEIALTGIGASKFGNYKITYQTGILTITKRATTVTAIGGTKEYDGNTFSGASLAYGALQGADQWSEVVSLTVSGAGTTAVNAGTYAVSPSILQNCAKANNYSITYKNGSVVISRKTITITAQNATKVYDGMAYLFSAENYTIEGIAATDTISEIATFNASGIGETAVSAGTHSFTFRVGSSKTKYNNYNITFVGATLTIQKRSATVTAVGGEKVYDGKVFGATYAISNLAEGDKKEDLGTATFGGAGATAVDANGTAYALSVSLAGGTKLSNYELTYTDGTVTITAKAVAVTFVSTMLTYNGQAQKPSASFVDVNSKTIPLNVTVDGEADGKTEVGTYNATASIEGGNYSLTGAKVSFEIKKATLAVVWTGNDFVYNKAEQVPTATAVGVQGEQLVFDVSITQNGISATAIDVGDYTAVATLVCQNYNFSNLNHVFKINKKQVLVTWSYSGGTADGQAHAPILNLDGAEFDGELTIIGYGYYLGTEVVFAQDVVGAGEYRAVVNYTSNNYEINNAELLFTIVAAETEVEDVLR